MSTPRNATGAAQRTPTAGPVIGVAIGDQCVITLIDGRITRGTYAATEANGQIVFRDERVTSRFNAKDLISIMPMVADESMQLARLAVHARTVRDDYSGLVPAWRRAREIAVKAHLGEITNGHGVAENDLKLAKDKLEECHKRFHNLWDRLLTYAPDMAERYLSLGVWPKDEPSAEQLDALARMAHEAIERAKGFNNPSPPLPGPGPASGLAEPVTAIEETLEVAPARPPDGETKSKAAAVMPDITPHDCGEHSDPASLIELSRACGRKDKHPRADRLDGYLKRSGARLHTVQHGSHWIVWGTMALSERKKIEGRLRMNRL